MPSYHFLSVTTSDLDALLALFNNDTRILTWRLLAINQQGIQFQSLKQLCAYIKSVETSNHIMDHGMEIGMNMSMEMAYRCGMRTLFV